MTMSSFLVELFAAESGWLPGFALLKADRKSSLVDEVTRGNSVELGVNGAVDEAES